MAWGCPVSELQRRLTYREFIEIVAYDQISPWGPERGDMQAALMPFAFAGAFAGKGKEPKFTDFMWPFGKGQKQDVGGKVWAAMESARMYQNRIHGNKPNG